MRADEAHSRFDRLHVLFAHYLWYILAKVPRVFQNDGDGRNESKRPKGSIYAFLIIAFLERAMKGRLAGGLGPGRVVQRSETQC